jgi:hypothetical protein
MDTFVVEAATATAVLPISNKLIGAIDGTFSFNFAAGTGVDGPI